MDWELDERERRLYPQHSFKLGGILCWQIGATIYAYFWVVIIFPLNIICMFWLVSMKIIILCNLINKNESTMLFLAVFAAQCKNCARQWKWVMLWVKGTQWAKYDELERRKWGGWGCLWLQCLLMVKGREGIRLLMLVKEAKMQDFWRRPWKKMSKGNGGKEEPAGNLPGLLFLFVDFSSL